MKHLLVHIGLIIVVALIGGCAENFSAAGPYDERVVLVSLLRMDTDTQYVRLYSTYDPATSNPATQTNDTEITDAVVTMVSGTDTVVFRDTVVQRSSPSKYGSGVHAYVANKFKPKQGTPYTVRAVSPTRGTLEASTRMMLTGNILLQTGYLEARFPSAYPLDESTISVHARLDSAAAAYMVRCIVEYSQLINNVLVKKYAEIPYHVKKGTDFRNFTPSYPTLLPKGFAPAPENSRNEIASFTLESYVTILRYLINTIGFDKIQFHRVRLVLNQVDQQTYSYYNIVNQSQGGISIRLDQSDYSNIKGGYGLFGSVSIIETFIPLPSEITLPQE